LAGDERALYELGILYDTRNKNGDARKAFEAFSKSSALGSLAGSTGAAMYYLQGKYVKKDTAFGIAALFSIFDDLYAKAVNQPQYLDTFGFCAYNIGACLEDGVGIAANKDRALRYYLLSRFASDAIIDGLGVKAPWGEPAESAVERLAGNLAPDRGNDLVLDEDTFYDSFYEQNDYLSHKTLTHIEYSETDGSVHMGLAFDRATLAIDVGNAQTAILSEMEWTFAEAKFELHPTQREFERIEFESPLTAVFIHDDPVLGEVRVLRIEFPPEPEGDERWH